MIDFTSYVWRVQKLWEQDSSLHNPHKNHMWKHPLDMQCSVHTSEIPLCLFSSSCCVLKYLTLSPFRLLSETDFVVTETRFHWNFQSSLPRFWFFFFKYGPIYLNPWDTNPKMVQTADISKYHERSSTGSTSRSTRDKFQTAINLVISGVKINSVRTETL